MAAALKLENGAPAVGSCGTELSALCRRFRVELRRVMDQEARQTTLADSRPMILSRPWLGATMLQYVTVLIMYNGENAVRFLGDGPYAL